MCHMLWTGMQIPAGMQLPHCHCILLPAVDTCRGAPPAPCHTSPVSFCLCEQAALENSYNSNTSMSPPASYDFSPPSGIVLCVAAWCSSLSSILAIFASPRSLSIENG